MLSIHDLYPARILKYSPSWRFPAVVGPCWEWKGDIGRSGYGEVLHKGRWYSTHRLSFALANGDIPDGMVVCHKCDVRACCNPEHLFAGTDEQSRLDLLKWQFVINGCFIPGDYDKWRTDVLFQARVLRKERRESFQFDEGVEILQSPGSCTGRFQRRLNDETALVLVGGLPTIVSLERLAKAPKSKKYRRRRRKKHSGVPRAA